ncbi:hypothetical protein LOC68_12275 [Blastopirellula sp. JC732]|uniref:Uncharacterized protein n=1 Tax=Blastopirellula sediminis TaxID=2894196 RepID=A0A9X1MM83_9BACT|nr:hypothetical protein [Blastopirellula sediminis]MCC9607531.1 hypothetical protein [Blastopirellula sediminis]MCC9629176.1 hypothetical protein [Blastopirellula sediminis]
MKRIPIVSREYKVMLESNKFGDLDDAVTDFWVDLCFFAHGNSRDATKSAPLRLQEEREIVFLDSPDHELRKHHGYVFRRRQTCGSKKAEYTLKLRGVDRYVAAGANVGAAEKVAEKQKFEEDLILLSNSASKTLVQHSRFSHSGAATTGSRRKTPTNVSEAAQLFPGLKGLPWSEKKRKRIPLCVVNDLHPHERVYGGAEFVFGEKKGERVKAEVAVILWTAGKGGKTIAAEFSFRYQDKRENYPPVGAEMAKDFFEALVQLSAWVRPTAPTKTAIVYGGDGA